MKTLFEFNRGNPEIVKKGQLLESVATLIYKLPVMTIPSTETILNASKNCMVNMYKVGICQLIVCYFNNLPILAVIIKADKFVMATEKSVEISEWIEKFEIN